jgi:hypothetical protein
MPAQCTRVSSYISIATVINQPIFCFQKKRHNSACDSFMGGSHNVFNGGIFSFLKGYGNEVDFLGFLHKLDPHRSLTLPFELFRLASNSRTYL